MEKIQKQKREVTFFWALVPIISMIVLISVGYFVFNARAEPLILTGTAIATAIALWHGYSWDDVLKSIVGKISEALPVILIVASIGFLIGAWIISGTIPLFVYYGLKWIDPNYFYVSAFLLGAIVSVCCGTSWGSMGTIGIALIGVATAMNLSLPIAAGAIVSGCWFGDKLSPLSDSTNMAAIAAGVEVYDHVGHMLWTTGPGFIICCILYTYFGMSIDVSEISEPEKIQSIINGLEAIYNFNPILLISPALILYCSITKKPAIPSLFFGTLISALFALTIQDFGLGALCDSMVGGFKASMLPETVDLTYVNTDVTKLIERGGAISMFASFVTVFSAFSFAGAMAVTGSLELVINSIASKVKSTFGLILTTIVSTLTVVCCTSNGILSVLLPGEAFKEVYKKRGLHPKNLSRTCEDSGTVVEPIVPWTASGAYCAAVLGVATLDYLPFAFLCYTGMIFAMIWGATGIGIAKLKNEENNPAEVAKAE